MSLPETLSNGEIAYAKLGRIRGRERGQPGQPEMGRLLHLRADAIQVARGANQARQDWAQTKLDL